MLTDVVNKEELYKWIDKEIGLAFTKVKPIIIITLQNWFNLTLDKLAIVLLVLTPFYSLLLATLIAALLATLITTFTTPTTPPNP